jgi:hypothetical protein
MVFQHLHFLFLNFAILSQRTVRLAFNLTIQSLIVNKFLVVSVLVAKIYE